MLICRMLWVISLPQRRNMPVKLNALFALKVMQFDGNMWLLKFGIAHLNIKNIIGKYKRPSLTQSHASVVCTQLNIYDVPVLVLQNDIHIYC